MSIGACGRVFTARLTPLVGQPADTLGWPRSGHSSYVESSAGPAASALLSTRRNAFVPAGVNLAKAYAHN